MSSRRDYYSILHVQPDAPVEIISASYRTLMQRLRRHPDLGGDHDEAALINEAYAVLGEPRRRAAYDAARSAERAAHAEVPQDGVAVAAAADDTAQLFAAMRCIFCAAPHGLQRAVEVDDECRSCASPLFPSERQRLDYSGQRMLARVAKTLAVNWYSTWPQAAAHVGELRDISLNGALLQAAVRVKADQIVKIDAEICHALARVAHCRRDPQDAASWLIGLEFLTLRFSSTRGVFVSARV
jgi:curved DNA-binding protein CbpA